MRAKIAEFKGWELHYDSNNHYGASRLYVYRPNSDYWDESFGSADGHWPWQRDRTLPELLLQAVSYIQEAMLKDARERNEIAMAQDLAKALIEDNLLGAIE